MSCTQSNTTYPFLSKQARGTYLSFYDEKGRQRWPSSLDNMTTERMIGTSFGQTFVRIVGSDNAPPLVLIPGDEETSLAWTFVVESLSRPYRVYALDRINDIGRSIPLSDHAHSIQTPQDYVVWLHEIVTKISPSGRPVHVVAHSYGAWQASLHAMAHPEQVERLVLLAPSATVLPPRLGVLLRAILYGSLPSTFQPVLKWYTKRYMYWFAPASVQKEPSRVIMDEMIQENLLARRCYKKRTFVPPTTFTDDEWAKLSVANPTLFMVGDKEVMYSPIKAIRRVERVAPSVKSVLVIDADHHLALVQPEQVQEQVLQFLRQSN
jgi:pimeloyl-ACP methyl ester carboxylesterase